MPAGELLYAGVKYNESDNQYVRTRNEAASEDTSGRILTGRASARTAIALSRLGFYIMWDAPDFAGDRVDASDSGGIADHEQPVPPEASGASTKNREALT